MPPPLRQFDDDQLVALIQQADRAGEDARPLWTELLARHQPRLYAVCLRMLGRPDPAADVLQDALVRIIRSLHQFDGRAQFGTWSTRIAMNACLSWLRRERHRRHPHLSALGLERDPAPADRSPTSSWASPPAPPRPAAASDPAAELDPALRVQTADDRAGEAERLLRALEQLSDEHRAILILRDVRGLEYEQIGHVLDLPLGTVRSRLFRARAALRQHLESPDPTPPTP